MNTVWEQLAQRIVVGLDIQLGELIQVRDQAGNHELLAELLLAIELAGATPLPQIMPPRYLKRMLAGASTGYLAGWDRQRAGWMQQIDRIVVLGSAYPYLAELDATALDAWASATQRLNEIEEARRLPFLVVALPSAERAVQLGMGADELEQHLLPALLVESSRIQETIRGALAAINGARTLLIRSGDGYELRLDQGDREWMDDDGVIDARDRQRGAIVSNLPAASIYTTVLEDSATGSLYLPRAGPASQAVLHFQNGQITKIEAATGGTNLEGWLDSHSGAPRRISHIGLGLNAALQRPIGWTIVDEHIQGSLFVALGENRYMGGQNSSSLNVDYALSSVTLLADGRTIVSAGQILF